MTESGKPYRFFERVAIVHAKSCGSATSETAIVLVERYEKDLHVLEH